MLNIYLSSAVAFSVASHDPGLQSFILFPIFQNLINITNENFVPVQIVDFSIQGVISKAVIGKTKISNLGIIQSRSQTSVRNVDADVSAPL